MAARGQGHVHSRSNGEGEIGWQEARSGLFLPTWGVGRPHFFIRLSVLATLGIAKMGRAVSVARRVSLLPCVIFLPV